MLDNGTIVKIVSVDLILNRITVVCTGKWKFIGIIVCAEKHTCFKFDNATIAYEQYSDRTVL